VSQTVASREREQSLGEEIANSVSHGVGLVAAVIAVPFLVVGAGQSGYTAEIVGVSVFATTMVLLYLVSTLYHALPRNRAKRVFRVLDHGAIYLLIAGTYTPFTLGVLGGAWGWTLFGLVWGLAVVGITLKAVGGVRFPKLSMYLYLAMGWLILVFIKPLALNMQAWGLFWLVGGGVAYTAGLAFYAAKRVRYCHFVWHLFVIAGTACHVIAVRWYAA
jgi:hemolysin III